MTTEHELKILPEFFNAVTAGIKNFELRFNDRGFEVGDTVILMEWKNGKYTGRRYFIEISYILEDAWVGLQPGFCIFSWVPEEDE